MADDDLPSTDCLIPQAWQLWSEYHNATRMGLATRVASVTEQLGRFGLSPAAVGPAGSYGFGLYGFGIYGTSTY
jgi:hypothetical protein